MAGRRCPSRDHHIDRSTAITIVSTFRRIREKENRLMWESGELRPNQSGPQRARPASRLTRCERNALFLAGLGWRDEETALLLGIDPATASSAVDSAVEKLGADSLEEAIGAARRDGVLR
jgi:DNA-binding CsgD family transcriptional regulator